MTLVTLSLSSPPSNKFNNFTVCRSFSCCARLLTRIDMAAPPPTSLLSFVILSQLAVYSCGYPKCHQSKCGTVPVIQFPFSYNNTSPRCGLYNIECEGNNRIPMIKLEERGIPYIVKSISYESTQLTIQEDKLVRNDRSQLCNVLHNFTVPSSPYLVFRLISSNFAFLSCKRGHETVFGDTSMLYSYTDCTDHVLYYKESKKLPAVKHNCSAFQYPVSDWLMNPYESKQQDLWTLLAPGFGLTWRLTHECEECHTKKRGFCSRNETTRQFICCGDDGGLGLRTKIIIGASVGIGSFLLCTVIFISIRVYRKKYYQPSSTLLSRAISFDPSFKSDIEKSNSPYPTQFFNYKELEEATNNFDPSRELGDGGFGTVYHGMLHDGRSVAVKRLYESNYRRVEQFKNEINILSHVRHQNLVTLYGCSSRHSRELLLVYEYIPNGTVADHLHGDRVKPGALTWPIRMSIAIETANALKYLHAVEIIHRDVKTNNILLDNNFRVKVADFGLSRLFPTDVTHVSTAPQGTPGYVDPDYHRCYQLTDKSDVYSFGVVMIELISSKPAVDISRHRYEINLANMAINKIHNHALHELVDPTLGFDSDYEVKRMITLVAELAFRCLQDEKDIRPSMEEVLDTLKGIESDGYKVEKAEDVGTPADDTVLLKNFPPLSPDTVTGAWESRTTTPNTSG